MKKKRTVFVLILVLILTACGKAAAGDKGVDYGQIQGDHTGLTLEIARAYLAVVDEFSAHLGYDEAEASEGECLHGGFLRDWDGDGVPELCLLLRTSPREGNSWDGTPLYGWYAPTLVLYTVRNGQSVRAGECDLYFATAGREASVAVRLTGKGMQILRWDRDEILGVSFVDCYALQNSALQKIETPADVTAALNGAETAQAFWKALGDDTVPLLYNLSGETKIEGEANARELRAALAAKAS